MDERIEARFHLTWPGFSLDVQLGVPGRGVTALFGHSGSGKTTVLRCVAGLERAPGGFLAINGRVWQDSAKDIFVPTHQRPLGYVFQEASLFPHLSVRQNLDFGRKRVPAAQRKVSFDHALGLLGIENLLERQPASLSGGERQRVAIARALANQPEVVLADEPTANLDSETASGILRLMRSLNEEKRVAFVVATHDPRVVAVARRTAMLRDGRFVGAP